MNLLRIAINSLSLCACIVIFSTMKLREKHLLKKTGKVEIRLEGRKSRLTVLIFAVSILLIGFQFFREFQLYVMAVMDLVAVLATYVAVREWVYQKNAGIYSECLIADGRLFEKKEIVALPTLQYENTKEFKDSKENDEYASDAYETSMKSLKILTENKGEIYIGFESAEERKRAVEVLKKWLKP